MITATESPLGERTAPPHAGLANNVSMGIGSACAAAPNHSDQKRTGHTRRSARRGVQVNASSGSVALVLARPPTYELAATLPIASLGFRCHLTRSQILGEEILDAVKEVENVIVAVESVGFTVIDDPFVRFVVLVQRSPKCCPMHQGNADVGGAVSQKYR